jgi:preprotein translocase subunit SecF
MSVGVRSLQRKLLLVTAGVSAVVGVAGYKMYSEMRAVAEALKERTTGTADVPKAGDERQVVVKRVLVRRIKDDPNDAGEIVETQLLGSLNEDALSKKKNEKQQSAPERVGGGLADDLTMTQKKAIFGGLVFVFVAFNFWAIPLIRRRTAGPQASSAATVSKEILKKHD